MKRISLLLALALAGSLAALPVRAAASDPHVVVALIDGGINPYSPAFRDPTAIGNPGSVIPDYPPDCAVTDLAAVTTVSLDCAIPLNLTFTGATLAEDYEADKATVWELVQPRQLYYINGTRIAGALSFDSGGTACPRHVGPTTVEFPPPAGGQLNRSSTDCPERLILDDMGHGTMTASRAAGAPHSLAPTARIVEIEGLGGGSSTWAAEQPWIDVQSNSWGSLVPAPADLADQRAFIDAAQKQMVMVASGNGLGFSGVAPTPTEVDSLGAPGVVLVGGHDNGHVTAWSGQPAQVVADAYDGYSAIHNSLEQMRPDPIACCTSTASPYAAGGAAAILLEARRLLGDAGTGIHDGVAAAGTPPAGVTTGPLADGTFTLAEWKDVLLHTAQARPTEGRDDGGMEFIGSARDEGGPQAPQYPQYGPGENPFCIGCFTSPVTWSEVPADYPAYLNVGYGAINEFSVATAADVLAGNVALPARPDEDAFFANDDAVRSAIFGATP